MSFFSGLFMCESQGWALERYGYIGVSSLAQLAIQPDVAQGDINHSLDLAYFPEEGWAAVLSWDIHINGSKRIGIALGPQLFLLSDVTVNPYIVVKFLYGLDPRNERGWRWNLGAEWNLVRWTDIDNLRIYGETGVSQLFFNQGSSLLSVEIVRAGISWNF